MTARSLRIERILRLSQSYEKTASRQLGRRDETANPDYVYAARTSTDPPTVKGAIPSGRANLRSLTSHTSFSWQAIREVAASASL
jgi:hypothetical protein